MYSSKINIILQMNALVYSVANKHLGDWKESITIIILTRTMINEENIEEFWGQSSWTIGDKINEIKMNMKCIMRKKS